MCESGRGDSSGDSQNLTSARNAGGDSQRRWEETKHRDGMPLSYLFAHSLFTGQQLAGRNMAYLDQ